MLCSILAVSELRELRSYNDRRLYCAGGVFVFDRSCGGVSWRGWEWRRAGEKSTELLRGSDFVVAIMARCVRLEELLLLWPSSPSSPRLAVRAMMGEKFTGLEDSA
jgi:hypothetical protein